MKNTKEVTIPEYPELGGSNINRADLEKRKLLQQKKPAVKKAADMIEKNQAASSLKRGKSDIYGTAVKALIYAGTLLSMLVLVFIVGYIFVKGIPNISPDLFQIKYNSENVSLFPALINTIFMTALALVISVPLGIFAAIFLSEYSNNDNKIVTLVRLTAETLSGIPSIIYGLFGALFFVVTLKMGLSLISGALTISIMILPLIIRTSEESLHSVPISYREGGFALGAGRLRTTFRIILPSAVPGILAGVILATGRIVGETAALIYTAGTVAEIPQNLFGSARTLSVHMYVLSSEGLHINQAYATAVILLAVVILINLLSSFIAKKVSKGA